MKKWLFFGFIIASSIGFIWYKNQVPPLPSTCAFCSPGTIENQIFYQDELVVCLLSYKPVYPGHSLVIPKRHVQRFEDCTPEEIAAMMAMIKKIHAAHQRLYGDCAYLILQKNGREVTQTVPHVHFHYIPRELGKYSELAIGWNFFWAGHIMTPLSKELLHHNATIMHEALA